MGHLACGCVLTSTNWILLKCSSRALDCEGQHHETTGRGDSGTFVRYLCGMPERPRIAQRESRQAAGGPDGPADSHHRWLSPLNDGVTFAELSPECAHLSGQRVHIRASRRLGLLFNLPNLVYQP